MTALCGEDTGWVDEIVALCTQRYVGADGLLVTSLAADGSVLDPTPLVADFGDVLPFLVRFGQHDFAERQIGLARPLLAGGLVAHGGRTRLFDNHDWLLGLLELHHMTGDAQLLALARQGGLAIIERMFVDDLLIDMTAGWRDPQSWLAPASPFNGGFIELWLELHELTGEAVFLDASIRLASRWERTDGFRASGVFHRILCAYSRSVDRLVRPGSTLSARLFKDNTNFVWSLLALHGATGDPRWKAMVGRWVEGFRRHFLNDGDVWLWLDRHGSGREVSLKAAFASIDLLCDIHLAEVADDALPMAETIARRWAGHQWPNGLFPEVPHGSGDHLDANVDMAIALAKLAGVTGSAVHAERARATARAVIERHRSPLGLVQAVGMDGAVRDGRIIVKYQGLALKLALAPADPRDLMRDPDLLKLLRDR